MTALPAIFVVLAWLWLLARDTRHRAIRCWMRALLLTGVWVVLVTEAFSLFGWITREALAVTWGLGCCLLAVGVVVNRRRLAEARLSFRRLASTRGEWALLAALGVVFGLTATVAWLAPPQTWDSLNYHMPRVAHWAQLHAVRPFATGIEVQNSRSPGAEFAVLHLYVLGASDRWVNFVEWMAMVGSVIGVAGLAGQLGLRRPASLLAAVFAATVPMGIIQASSTMTDYVVALWLVATAGEVLGLARDESPNAALLFAAAGSGLALVTKPTAAPYLLPFFLLAAGWLWQRRPPVRTWVVAGIGVALLLVLNLGSWIRNTVVYGDPLTGGDQLSVHANQLRSVGGLVSNVVRNLALEMGTPSPYVNKGLTLGILELHRLLRVDPNDPRTTAHGAFQIDKPTTNEIKAGSVVHLLVGFVAGVYVVARRKAFEPVLLLYLLAILGGFTLFCWIFKWQIFGGRYHLPFFLLLAPIAAAAISHALSWRGALATGWILILSSLPWLVGVSSRPLIPLPGETKTGSVLAVHRQTLLFANGPYLEAPFTEMAQVIQRAGCEVVSIALSGNQAEYPLWVLLGAPRRDLWLEWNVAGTPSAKYLNSEPEPCAVICEGCEGSEQVRGLPLVWSRDAFRLFLAQPEGR